MAREMCEEVKMVRETERVRAREMCKEMKMVRERERAREMC